VLLLRGYRERFSFAGWREPRWHPRTRFPPLQAAGKLTQGESLEDLKAHLADLHYDLTSGEIPCVRRHAELELA